MAFQFFDDLWNTIIGKPTKKEQAQQRLDDATARYNDLWSGLSERVTDAENKVSDALGGFSEAASNNITEVRYDDQGRPAVYATKNGGATWKKVRDYNAYYDKLDELANSGFQDFNAYGGQRLTDMRSGYDNLVGQIEAGPTNADRQAAAENAARLAGFSSDAERDAWMRQHQERLDRGVSGQQGLSNDERSVIEDYNRRNLRAMEQDAQKQLESIMANTGSTSQYLMAADEVRSQIQDQRVASQVRVLEEDFERKNIEYENLKDQYWRMYQAGAISEEGFLNGIRQDRMNALQGYAQGIAQLQSNFQADNQALALHAETIYKAINTQLGIDQAAMDQAYMQYDMMMMPHMQQLEAAITQFNTSVQAAGAQANIGQLQLNTDMYISERQAEVDAMPTLFEGFLNFGIGVATTAIGIATGNPLMVIGGASSIVGDDIQTTTTSWSTFDSDKLNWDINLPEGQPNKSMINPDSAWNIPWNM